jgi:glycyl-tRNA synthetase beta subunit
MDLGFGPQTGGAPSSSSCWRMGGSAFHLLLAGAAGDGEQAAGLCKADLATSMVMEMTALAGIMGRHYALNQGIKPQVAEVRQPFYLPL